MNPTLFRLLAGTLAASTPHSAHVTINELSAAPEAPHVLTLNFWHVAGLVSAAITIGLYLWAGTLRNQLDSDGFSGEADERSTLRIIKAVLATRAMLTTYTMACGIVAFAKAAEWKWAQFSVQFLP